MTALALSPADTAELASLRADVHRLRTVIDACDKRIATLDQRNRALVHAAEQAGIRVWPVHVRCDGRCGAVVAFDPEPEEARLAAALVALGWSGHVCPTCARRGLPCP